MGWPWCPRDSRPVLGGQPLLSSSWRLRLENVGPALSSVLFRFVLVCVCLLRKAENAGFGVQSSQCRHFNTFESTSVSQTRPVARQLGVLPGADRRVRSRNS